MQLTRFLPAAFTLAAFGCGPVAAQVVPPGFQYQTVTTGLQGACAMAFAPDGRLFVCERLTGRVRVVRDGVLAPQPWHSVGYTSNPTGESGLLGIAIDPGFLTNGYVYLYYTDPNGSQNRIARVRDSNGTGVQATVLSPNWAIPTHPFRVHNGGRMVVGHDGRLYVSVGDAEDQQTPQDPAQWPGKVLRFDLPNLTVPASNPTAGSPAWCLGVRNSYGLAVHPTQGWLLATENGYLVGDELNRILGGGNCGWPQYEGGGMPSGFDQPLLTIQQQPVLTGIAFHHGPMYPPAYQGCLYMCGWLEGPVRRLTLSANGQTLVANDAFADHDHAFDVQLGPDGTLWVLHGPGLQGGDEVGRYVHTNAPSPGLYMAPVQGPSLGGSLTFGVTAQDGDLVAVWLSFANWQPPVATAFGPISTPADAVLPFRIVTGDDRSYSSLEFPNVPTFVGLPLHAQAVCIDPATGAGEVTNAITHVLR